MIIYPAIDLRGGKVVRLKEGDPNRQTVFSDDPVATARQWIEQGTEWIHMVSLDGTFSEANTNGQILEQVAQLGIRIQFGGGLRTIGDIEQAIERGAARVVIGTAAIQQPEIVTQALERWGAEAVCVALDARDGKIAMKGWQENSGLDPVEVGQQMATRGVIHALYTDISRDGLLQGVNIDSTTALANATGLNVIASGGVSTIEEIRQMAQSGIIAGAVIGMALYEGRITLRDALTAVSDVIIAGDRKC
ncbi:MAG: 1-(5-phosphoribosyl)-5-[(5-phosphoribosylamino)methylideneamino]imidazole-4-carboxamide isomerase [Burkholderiales bacterium]|nr:1-(5-phosphoribosyl)-5-[(5-phosphoribosylamino)methylideneamino]imidazole-4-carboxamide isomerase [Anaerolineae bacterium]